MKNPNIAFLGLAALAAIFLITPASAVVSIDYVAVGNPGNAANPADGNANLGGVQNFGAVSYSYQIAKNETTITQFAGFLNAVAKRDTYGIYNSEMATNPNSAGIIRSGSSGNYTYSVIGGSGNKPITFVSWFDGARFCNWLHHGQPTGLQTTGTTEDGAYALLGAVSGIVQKNAGAKAWLPSEDEWYKAAYYDPTKNAGAGGYWQHGNQSDAMVSNTVGVAGASNFSGTGLTNGGAYGADSDSFYGTNDQAGNVSEWNDGLDPRGFRSVRGGAWFNSEPGVSSAVPDERLPQQEWFFVGFRVATVPEPSSLVLTVLAGGGLLTRRKR